jgi:hypothetical protein
LSGGKTQIKENKPIFIPSPSYKIDWIGLLIKGFLLQSFLSVIEGSLLCLFKNNSSQKKAAGKPGGLPFLLVSLHPYFEGKLLFVYANPPP